MFPELERIFPTIHKPTPFALLEAFAGRDALLGAPKRQVLAVREAASRNHFGAGTYARRKEAAETSLGLPLAQGVPSCELPFVIERLRLYERHLNIVEREMAAGIAPLLEAEYLLTILGVKAVTPAREVLKIMYMVAVSVARSSACTFRWTVGRTGCAARARTGLLAPTVAANFPGGNT